MLQVDAKRRITIRELLVHPWLLEGYDRPIKWQSKYHGNDLEASIVEEMAAYKLTSPSSLSDRLKRWDYDYLTATYLLMFEKKAKGHNYKLTPNGSPLATHDLVTPKRNLLKDLEPNSANASPSSSAKPNSLANSPRALHNSLEGGLDDVELLKMGNTGNTPNKEMDRASKNRASERYPVPNKKKTEDNKENSR